MSEGMFGEKREQNVTKRTPLQLLGIGGGWVMFWARVDACGMRNISLVDGRMDSSKYQQIMEANITPSVPIAEDEKRMTTG